MPEPGGPTDQPLVLKNGDEVHLVTPPPAGGTVDVDGVGVLGADLFDDIQVGDLLDLGRTSYRVLEPTPQLIFETLERRAQVVRPQDAARIAHLAGIGPGTRVVEGGAGSGALTAYLASLVGSEGHVLTVDTRKDHLSVARRNVERVGLDEQVTFREGRLEDVEETSDAFVADVPSPVDVLPAAKRSLRAGGRAVFYNPLVDQVQEIRQALAEGSFAAVRSLEVLERGWVVHERGARPDFDMLGHTGFITVATRVSEPA